MGDVEALHERIHVLQAVELAQTANVGVGNGHELVSRTISVDKPFDMARLDLAAVVDNLSSGRDQDLSKVAGREVNLGESK